MGRTPDRRPGEQFEDDRLIFEDRGADPTEVGAIWRNGSDLKGRDATGVFNLRSGTGLSEAQHEDLDSLVHNLAETSYCEVTRTSGKVTAITHWTDNGKTTKIRETLITRTSGKVSQVEVKQYDGSGTLVQTLTGTITRTSGRVSSIRFENMNVICGTAGRRDR